MVDAAQSVGTSDNSRAARRKKLRSDFLGRAADKLLPISAIAILLAILLGLYLWNALIVVIKSGEAGALYRPFGGGTVTDFVYPEGLHFMKPWNKMHVYNIRVQTVLHEFEVLTNKGLTIKLTLAVRYHPEREMVGLLHQKVGPDYVDTIVIPQIESVLRRNVGKHDPEDIYTNKEGILTDIIVKAIEEAGQKFVFIDDIIIRTVALPDEIRRAIKDKLVHQQRWHAYEFILATSRREAERKRIESQGIRDYQATINETLTADLVLWEGIKATRDLASSTNSKIVVIGSGQGGLPVILGADSFKRDDNKTAPMRDGKKTAPAISVPEGGSGALSEPPDLLGEVVLGTTTDFPPTKSAADKPPGYQTPAPAKEPRRGSQ